MRRIAAITLGMAVAAAIASCGDDDGSGDHGTPDDGGTSLEATWASIREDILPGCTNQACHGADSGNLVLESDVAYANLVDQPSSDLPQLDLVEPGDAEASYFYRKVAGTHGAACEEEGRSAAECGSRMPLGGSPLTTSELAAIETWIRDGAPEN